MKNIKYIPVICILLVFICGSFGCIQNNELEESFNELNNTVNEQEDIINNLENMVDDNNKFLENYSKAKVHTLYGIESIDNGDMYWNYAIEDDYYVDLDYLDWSIEEYEYAVYCFGYSNEILNELSTVIPDNNFIKTDIENLININTVGENMAEHASESTKHYSMSAEVESEELIDRYYNMYLDSNDKTNELVDEYNSLYKILFEHNSININW